MDAKTSRPMFVPDAEFAAILRPDTNVVGLPRPLDPGLQAKLAAVARGSGFHQHTSLDATAPDPSGLPSSIRDSTVRSGP